MISIIPAGHHFHELIGLCIRAIQFLRYSPVFGAALLNGGANNGQKRQVSYRIDAQLAKEMEEAATYDGIKELGPFCRELTEWAFDHYRKAKSLFLLKNSEVKYPEVRVKKSRNTP